MMLKNAYRKFKEITTPLVLIHVGKCGGSTVREELLSNDYKFFEKHIGEVDYDKSKQYIIVIRNPISRCMSAFNWRYKLVCETKEQQFRFPGEYELLKQFESFNHFAESLFDESGEIQIDLSQPEYYIHHIKEDIYFYIGTFLKEFDKENVKAVLTTENLNSDMKENFGIDVKTHLKKNKNKTKEKLSERAVKNLKLAFKNDYWCIDKLYEANLISPKNYAILSK
ncbi:hypothetical protein [Roseivirga sp.]|uniref:hypothetical protein n=1 Tax=Roseivirga sp. TaxID=1964215 RepID=UPI003B8CDC4F